MILEVKSSPIWELRPKLNMTPPNCLLWPSFELWFLVLFPARVVLSTTRCRKTFSLPQMKCTHSFDPLKINEASQVQVATSGQPNHVSGLFWRPMQFRLFPVSFSSVSTVCFGFLLCFDYWYYSPLELSCRLLDHWKTFSLLQRRCTHSLDPLKINEASQVHVVTLPLNHHSQAWPWTKSNFPGLCVCSNCWLLGGGSAQTNSNKGKLHYKQRMRCWKMTWFLASCHHVQQMYSKKGFHPWKRDV